MNINERISKKVTAIALSLVLLGASIAVFTPQAYSQPPAEGDLIEDLVIPNSAGVGIGFDGTYLYWLDFSGTKLHKITTSGSFVEDIQIIGCTATVISYDASSDVFWGMAGNQISIINPNTGDCIPQFTVDNVNQFALVDGLDYDPSDGTLWFSPDASTVVYHVDTTGNFLGSFTVDTFDECGFNYNSGIATGFANVIYLAADGCDYIFKYDKDGNKLSFFKIEAARHEDMECDNVTFRDLDTDAIWIKDAFDNHIRAFAVPKGTCGIIGVEEGRMTGGGSIVSDIGRVTHGFEIHCNVNDEPNNLEINWGKGNKFHLEQLTKVFCFDDPNISEGKPVAGFDTIKGTGTGRYNNQPATIEFTFTDAGEPGVNDYAKIVISDSSNNVVLDIEGTLNKGNHQAHPS